MADLRISRNRDANLAQSTRGVTGAAAFGLGKEREAIIGQPAVPKGLGGGSDVVGQYQAKAVGDAAAIVGDAANNVARQVDARTKEQEREKALAQAETRAVEQTRMKRDELRLRNQFSAQRDELLTKAREEGLSSTETAAQLQELETEFKGIDPSTLSDPQSIRDASLVNDSLKYDIANLNKETAKSLRNEEIILNVAEISKENINVAATAETFEDLQNALENAKKDITTPHILGALGSTKHTQIVAETQAAMVKAWIGNKQQTLLDDLSGITNPEEADVIAKAKLGEIKALTSDEGPLVEFLSPGVRNQIEDETSRVLKGGVKEIAQNQKNAIAEQKARIAAYEKGWSRKIDAQAFAMMKGDADIPSVAQSYEYAEKNIPVQHRAKFVKSVEDAREYRYKQLETAREVEAEKDRGFIAQDEERAKAYETRVDQNILRSGLSGPQGFIAKESEMFGKTLTFSKERLSSYVAGIRSKDEDHFQATVTLSERLYNEHPALFNQLPNEVKDMTLLLKDGRNSKEGAEKILAVEDTKMTSKVKNALAEVDYEAKISDAFGSVFSIDPNVAKNVTDEVRNVTRIYVENGLPIEAATDKAIAEIQGTYGKTDITSTPMVMAYPPSAFGFKPETEPDLKKSLAKKLESLGQSIDDVAELRYTGARNINGEKTPVYNILVNTTSGFATYAKNPDGSNIFWMPTMGDLAEVAKEGVDKEAERIAEIKDNALNNLFSKSQEAAKEAASKQE